MTLSELSIRRHVFAFMLSAVLVLFGAIAYQRMGVDKLPYIEYPIISITTVQRGANPDIIDASITNLIETAVNSVPGIEHIASTSTPGHLAGGDHLRPGEAHRRRVPGGAGQGEPGGAAPAEGRRSAGGGEGRDQHAGDPADRAAGRPHPAAAQPLRDQRHQEAARDHRRRGRSAHRRPARPQHPRQPAAGEDGRATASRRRTSPMPSAASTSSSPAASWSGARPSTW